MSVHDSHDFTNVKFKYSLLESDELYFNIFYIQAIHYELKQLLHIMEPGCNRNNSCNYSSI